jgi:hypothetical protein
MPQRDDQTFFFPPRLVQADEFLATSLTLDSAQAVFLWHSETSDVLATLALTSKNGRASHVKVSSEWGLRAIARSATLHFSADVRIEALQIPSALCRHLFYTAPVAFIDDLRSRTAFCAFFGHKHFYTTVDVTL